MSLAAIRSIRRGRTGAAPSPFRLGFATPLGRHTERMRNSAARICRSCGRGWVRKSVWLLEDPSELKSGLVRIL